MAIRIPSTVVVTPKRRKSARHLSVPGISSSANAIVVAPQIGRPAAVTTTPQTSRLSGSRKSSKRVCSRGCSKPRSGKRPGPELAVGLFVMWPSLSTVNHSDKEYKNHRGTETQRNRELDRYSLCSLQTFGRIQYRL